MTRLRLGVTRRCRRVDREAFTERTGVQLEQVAVVVVEVDGVALAVDARARRPDVESEPRDRLAKVTWLRPVLLTQTRYRRVTTRTRPG
jgi:hypothetical protein